MDCKEVYTVREKEVWEGGGKDEEGGRREGRMGREGGGKEGWGGREEGRKDGEGEREGRKVGEGKREGRKVGRTVAQWKLVNWRESVKGDHEGGSELERECKRRSRGGK